MPSSLHQKCLLLWVLLSVLLLVQRSAKLLVRLSVRLSVLVSVFLDLSHIFSTFSYISLTFSTFSSCRFSTFGHYLSLLRPLLHRELSSLYCCRCLLFVLGLLQASFLRTRPCDELRIGTLLHSPVDGRDEQLHLSHAHRALETTFSQPAMLLALRLRLLVGFILRLLVCFDLGSSLLVCFYSWPPRACRRG